MDWEDLYEISISYRQSCTRIAQAVFAGGDNGIALFDGKRFRILSANHIKPLALTAGIAEPPDGTIWIYSAVSIIRMKVARPITLSCPLVACATCHPSSA